MLKLKTQSNRP